MSLEFIALVPVLLLVATYALQAGLVAWASSSTTEAARATARAASLGRTDLRGIAEDSLPGALTLRSVSATNINGQSVTLVVEVPKVAPLGDFTITRTAVMP